MPRSFHRLLRLIRLCARTAAPIHDASPLVAIRFLVFRFYAREGHFSVWVVLGASGFRDLSTGFGDAADVILMYAPAHE
jgi:hypothetical protein